jgi:hypothetical protein
MVRIHPCHVLGWFDRRDVEVHDDGLLVAAHHDTAQRFVGVRIDFLRGTKGETYMKSPGPASATYCS